MTQTQNRNPASTEKEPDKLNLSATQVVASGLAAVSSTVVASYFGVAGTVIGAAIGAVMTVTGNAVYSYSLRRTRNRVLDLAVAQRFNSTRTVAVSTDATPAASERIKPARTPIQWHPKRLALAAAGLFVVIMGATTAFELASGQPLSSTVTGDHLSGTSLGGTKSQPAKPTPAPATTHSVSTSNPASGASPTVTVTVTPSDSGSATSSPTGSIDGSGSPTSSGPATSTPTPTPTPSG